MTLTPYINLITPIIVALALWKGFATALLCLVALRYSVPLFQDLSEFLAWQTERSISLDHHHTTTEPQSEPRCPLCNKEIEDENALLQPRSCGHNDREIATKKTVTFKDEVPYSAGFFYCDQCDDFWAGVELVSSGADQTPQSKHSYIIYNELAKQQHYNWTQLQDATKTKHRVIRECSGCARPETTHERRLALKRVRYWDPFQCFRGLVNYMGLDECLQCGQQCLCSWNQLY